MQSLRLSILFGVLSLMMIASPQSALAISPTKQTTQCSVSLLSMDETLPQSRSATVGEATVALMRFLQKRGHEASLTNATGSELVCKGEGKIRVTLIPFVSSSNAKQWSSYIAIWSGMWRNQPFHGEIALQKAKMYRVQNGNVIEAESNWIDNLPVPLQSIQGPTPLLAPMDIHTTLHQGTWSSGCMTDNVAKTQYTLLGFVAYKFWQSKQWCWNGTKVYNVNVSTFLSNVDPNFYYRGIVAQWDRWASDKKSWSDTMRQGQFDNCVAKYGCIGTTYPKVQMLNYKDGKYSYTTN